MIEHLELLRRHGAWADARLLAALKAAPEPPSGVLRELAHVRGAQATWLARIAGEEPLLPIWPELTLAELEEVGAVLDEKARLLHAGLDAAGLEQVVRYVNSRGEAFATPLHDVLLHVALHGQYHRGKANAGLRAAGLEPVAVDYIAWSRLGRP
ncbi:MAG: DinB family protein [Actinomycetes bacterium]